jgi:lichenan operon transcriptional antiterminator
MFPQYDVKYVYGIIMDTCKQYRYFVNEYSMLTLLLDIIISIDRIKNDLSLQDQSPFQNSNTPEELFVKDIIGHIEEHFKIVYNDLELNEIAIIIVSSLVKNNYSDITMENIEQSIEPDCTALIQPINTHLMNYDFIDLENDKFMSRLILHINNLLQRLKKKYTKKKSAYGAYKDIVPDDI